MMRCIVVIFYVAAGGIASGCATPEPGPPPNGSTQWIAGAERLVKTHTDRCPGGHDARLALAARLLREAARDGPGGYIETRSVIRWQVRAGDAQGVLCSVQSPHALLVDEAQLTDVAEAFAHCGDERSMYAALRLVPETYPTRPMLVALATAKARAGDADGARQVFEEFRAREILPEVLPHIGAADWRAGRFERGQESWRQALRQAQAMPRETDEVSVIVALIRLQRQTGASATDVALQEHALALIRRMTDRAARSFGLREVAADRAAAGQHDAAAQLFDEAMDAAMQTMPADAREPALVDTAAAAGRAGRYATALRAAPNVKPWNRAAVLLFVAAARARAGDRAGAIDTAAQTSFLHNYAGRFDHRNPSTWSGPYEATGPGWGLVVPTPQYLCSDLVAAAMELHLALGDSQTDFAAAFSGAPIEAIRAAAAAQARAGDIDDALSWSRALPRGGKRAAALLGIAAALVSPTPELREALGAM